MVLVDISVWIDYLRRDDTHLRSLLDEGAEYVHPYVVAELALGRIRNRAIVLGLIR